MAKLYIPACGDRLVVTKPWEFDLYLESRNIDFAKHHNLIAPNTSSWGLYVNGRLNKVRHTIEPDTVLECDRVYIRSTSKSAKSVEDSYDSVTWKIVVGEKARQKLRFWVKLSDCYNLEFDPDSISRYQDRK